MNRIESGDFLETPFDRALTDLESPEPRRRLEGITSLLTVGDARALQVARALQRDEDPDIRLEASRVLRKLQAAGVRERLLPGQEQARERAQLDTAYQVLDEVFFALSRNIGNVAWAALTAGVPKLAFAAVLIWWHPNYPVLGGSFDRMIPLIAMGCLFFQQLIGRPFTWALIGRAVLGGFADQASRRLGETPISGFQLAQLGKINLRERFKLLPFYGLLSVAALDTSDGAFAAFLAVLTGVVTIRLSPLNMPFQLLLSRSSGDTATQAGELRLAKDWVVGFSWSTFLAQCFGLYLLFFAVFILALDQFFGCIPPRAFFASVVLADVVVDPFWIGYRLLTARLVLNSSQRVNA